MRTAIALIFFFCFAPVVVFADHHRGHSVLHIDEAILRIDQSISFARSYRDHPRVSSAGFFHANKYLIYAGKYRDSLISARVLLTSDGDLDDVRRLLNSPGSNTDVESVLWGYGSIEAILANLVNDDAHSTLSIRKMLSLHSKSVQAANHALWHINDAIREEVYGDRDFICSGPNNHCE